MNMTVFRAKDGRLLLLKGGRKFKVAKRRLDRQLRVSDNPRYFSDPNKQAVWNARVTGRANPFFAVKAVRHRGKIYLGTGDPAEHHSHIIRGIEAGDIEHRTIPAPGHEHKYYELGFIGHDGRFYNTQEMDQKTKQPPPKQSQLAMFRSFAAHGLFLAKGSSSEGLPVISLMRRLLAGRERKGSLGLAKPQGDSTVARIMPRVEETLGKQTPAQKELWRTRIIGGKNQWWRAKAISHQGTIHIGNGDPRQHHQHIINAMEQGVEHETRPAGPGHEDDNHLYGFIGHDERFYTIPEMEKRIAVATGKTTMGDVARWRALPSAPFRRSRLLFLDGRWLLVKSARG
jgi:hypothetical protein